MGRHKLSLVACATLVMLALVSAAWAGTQFSNVGVKNLVTLVSSFDVEKSTMDFIRLNRDGSAETKFYRIKSGNFLVVTDVQFTITGGTPGQLVTLEMLIVKLSNISKFTVPFSIPVRLDGDGNGSGTITLNAGFAIDSNARPGADTPGSDLIQSHVQIILQGYTSG